MLGNLLSMATSALRSPYVSGTGYAPRVNPKVHEDRAAANTPAAAPPDSTRFIERPRLNTGGDMYARNGALMQAGSSISTQRNDTMDFQVTTAEGDIVTISMANTLSRQETQARVRSANGMASGATLQSSQTLAMEIQVQGDLSAEETQAIKELAQDAGKVAKAFYAGDMQEATQAASHLREEDLGAAIDAFSLSLHSDVTRKAVAMYQEVAQTSQAPQNAPSQAPPEPSTRPVSAPSPQSVQSIAAPPTAPQDTGSDNSMFSSLKDLLKRLSSMLDNYSPASTAAPASTQTSAENMNDKNLSPLS